MVDRKLGGKGIGWLYVDINFKGMTKSYEGLEYENKLRYPDKFPLLLIDVYKLYTYL